MSLQLTYQQYIFQMICVLMLHIVLTIAYIIFALFAGASTRTLFGIIFYLHSILGLVAFIFLMLLLNETDYSVGIFIQYGVLIGFTLDLIVGLYVAPTHRIYLTFIGIGIIPSSLISILTYYKVNKVIWLPYLPYLVFFFIYFSLCLISYFKCSQKILGISKRFFGNHEISVEFEASQDFESFWNSAYWRDDSGFIVEKDASSSSDDDDDDDITNSSFAMSLLDTKKKDLRFPKKEKFQLYKVDGKPQNPFFVVETIPLLLIAGLIVLCFFNTFYQFEDFFYYISIAISLIFFSAIIVSRTFSYNCCLLTNMDQEWINTLWDHPALSIV